MVASLFVRRLLLEGTDSAAESRAAPVTFQILSKTSLLT